MARTGTTRGRRIAFWLTFVLAAALLATGAVALHASVHVAADNETSMQNTLRPGDRLLYVSNPQLRRGDIVMERVPAPAGSPDLVVRRVIGLPGDHVACCTAQGRVTVNGKALDETYLYPGNAPSTTRFSVSLAPGRYWLMGDHRSVALDSRSRGPIPASGIAGRVIAIIRGASFTRLRTPATYVTDRLAPVDTRPVGPIGWLPVGTVSALVLLVLSVFGIVSWVRRRRLG